MVSALRREKDGSLVVLRALDDVVMHFSLRSHDGMRRFLGCGIDFKDGLQME